MRAMFRSRCQRLLSLAALLLVPALPALAARDGFVSERSAAKRALDYLRFATEEPATGNILNAIAHMERDRVDPPPGLLHLHRDAPGQRRRENQDHDQRQGCQDTVAGPDRSLKAKSRALSQGARHFGKRSIRTRM